MPEATLITQSDLMVVHDILPWPKTHGRRLSVVVPDAMVAERKEQGCMQCENTSTQRRQVTPATYSSPTQVEGQYMRVLAQ